jgi:predicted acyl esterase
MARASIAALAVLALAAAPAEAGFRDSCQRAKSTDAKPVAYRICTGMVASFDGTPLDTTLTLPARTKQAGRGKRAQPLPLVVFLHGFLNDKGEYISQSKGGTGPDRGDAAYKTVELNNVWFASRGYAVLNYSARGHGASGGEIGLASKFVDTRDTQQLTGVLVDLGIARRNRIAAIGGSYGGGQTWLLATVRGKGVRQYGSWLSPKGKVVRLAAAVPQFTWTDLLFSLAPNGRDEATPTPFGVPKISLLNGFLASINTKMTEDVRRWLARVNQGEPYDGDPIVEEAKRALTVDRSAYYQDGFFAALQRKSRRQRAIPILAAQGWTDPIFPAIEAVRMYRRLRFARPGYPIQLYFGDFEHLTAQVKIPDLRYYHRLANTLLDRYLLGRRRRPAFDVRSAPTLCDPNRFGPVVRALTWRSLQPDRLRFELTGTRMTSSSAMDPRGPMTDHVVIGLQRRGCITTDLPDSAGVATWHWDVERDFTLIGMPRIELSFSTIGDDVQLNSRLWDVAPDGVQTLVTRGAYRLVAPPMNTPQQLAYDLFGNHWLFQKGHRVMLEVTGDDSTFFRSDNFPSTTTIDHVALTLPGEG